MKVNLDAELDNMGAALNAAFLVQNQNPDLEVGTKITINSGGVRFNVTRNKTSWLVKERQSAREMGTPLPEAFTLDE